MELPEDVPPATSQETEEITKSSNEILTELFSTFNAAPPVIVKKEAADKDGVSEDNDEEGDDNDEDLEDGSKEPGKKENQEPDQATDREPKRSKHKKSKKKHKHKKHIKKEKDGSGSDRERRKHKKHKKRKRESDGVDLDCVKTEGGTPPKKVKIEKTDVKDEKEPEVEKVENGVQEVKETTGVKKIQIKNLKNSSVYEATIREVEKEALKKQEKELKRKARYEEGEITGGSTSSSDYDDNWEKSSKKTCTHKKSKKSSKSGESSSKRRRSSSASRKDKEKEKNRDKDRDRDKKTSSSRDKDEHRHNPFYRSERSERDRDDHRDKDYHKRKDDHRSSLKDSRSSSNFRYSRDSYRDRSSHDRNRRDSRERYRSNSRSRYREYSPDKHYKNSSIDKKKLLEIARKNAINMLKSGSLPGALTLGPQAQEKVIAAIKAGGKTVEELTDFCKTLSKKEEMGELSSISGSEVDSDTEKHFHHPFQIKEKPSSIVMNIKNAVPLPTKSLLEKTSELRMQFPVSSGQHHRKTENDWVPVSPKAIEAPPLPAPAPVLSITAPEVPLAIEAPPVEPAPKVFTPPTVDQKSVDIGSIVSQRLTAMRKLQENPNDVQAITQIYKAQKEMQNWAESKQQPGQFTGSTGAQILTAAELSSGAQAWARKNQLQNAAPVSGGMGMHLLQKMGWKPGEGLGKEKSGALEPLLLEVKLDKKGLVANEESKNKKVAKVKPVAVKQLAGKHPVSLLGEFASKRKIGVPSYDLCFECGPDHKKNFLFKVTLNGVEYKPSIASANKKQAKADAATVCLQQLGIL